MENEKDTTLTAITSGSKYFSNFRSPATSHTQTLSNPFRNLTNKVRGKIKKSSCVFFPACVVYSCVFIIGRLNYYCIGMYPAYICIFLHESAGNITLTCFSIRTASLKMTAYYTPRKVMHDKERVKY